MRQSLRTHPLVSLQAASRARAVVEDLRESRFPVSAAIVFHRVGLLGRTMGFKKNFFNLEIFFDPHCPTQ